VLLRPQVLVPSTNGSPVRIVVPNLVVQSADAQTVPFQRGTRSRTRKSSRSLMCLRHHHEAPDRNVRRCFVEDLGHVVLPSSPTSCVKKLRARNCSYELRRGYQVLDISLAKPVFRQISNSISISANFGHTDGANYAPLPALLTRRSAIIVEVRAAHLLSPEFRRNPKKVVTPAHTGTPLFRAHARSLSGPLSRTLGPGFPLPSR